MSDQNIKEQAQPSAPASAADLCGLGNVLEQQRKPALRRFWRLLFFCLLAVLVALNFLVSNEHPHFGLDVYPGFWPAFGLVVGVIMIFFVKKIVQPFIKRPEDYYGDL